LTRALEGDALAAAADRQLPIDGSIQRLRLQIGRQWLNLVNVRDLRLAVTDRCLPGQAGGLYRTTRSVWHVVGGCLAGRSHGARAKYHRPDERALDFG